MKETYSNKKKKFSENFEFRFKNMVFIKFYKI